MNVSWTAVRERWFHATSEFRDYAIIWRIVLLGAGAGVELQFLQDNWPLILIVVVSGGMLLWPMIGRRWSAIREVGAMEATQLINRRNALMLDVREPKEYEGGRVPNAVHLPASQLASRGQELAKLTGRPVIAYCERGQRSRAAASALAKLGFAEVYTLRGGLRAWSDAGLPVDKGA